MREVLTSAEPDARGADARLIDVLGDASRLAAQRFVGQPDQEGAVRVMLGQVYTHLAQDKAGMGGELLTPKIHSTRALAAQSG
jgi:hypothetical protein